MPYLALLWEKRNEQIILILEHTEIHNSEGSYIRKNDLINLWKKTCNMYWPGLTGSFEHITNVQLSKIRYIFGHSEGYRFVKKPCNMELVSLNGATGNLYPVFTAFHTYI
jgi:hypothetical protein